MMIGRWLWGWILSIVTDRQSHDRLECAQCERDCDIGACETAKELVAMYAYKRKRPA